MNKVLCAITMCLSATSVVGKDKMPNIVLINIDDLGWSDLSFQGSKYYETPNIDKLRVEGLFFSQCYAGAANSAPSRASLMTGLYAPRHGVYTVNPPDRGAASDRRLISAENRSTPSSEYILLSEVLQSRGYATCHVGKWHLGEDPTTQGMDVNIGGNKSGHPKSYFSPYKNPNLSDGDIGEFLTDRLTAEAIEFVREQDAERPFFLYFAPYAVHTPLQPKPDIASKYQNKVGAEAHNDYKYAALVESTDYNVGRLLDVLDKCENTIVILTSDNGGVYNLSKQWPLRAGKGSFYEGGIRVPLIVKWDGHTTANATNNSPVTQLDFYPTLLDIVGADSSSLQLDGVNIRPLIEGEDMDLDDRAIFWHFPAYLEMGNIETTDSQFRSRPLSVIRKGDWKLIKNYETEAIELYNLIDDISEQNNLVSKKQIIVGKLTRELDQWLADTNAPIIFKKNPLFVEE